MAQLIYLGNTFVLLSKWQCFRTASHSERKRHIAAASSSRKAASSQRIYALWVLGLICRGVSLISWPIAEPLEAYWGRDGHQGSWIGLAANRHLERFLIFLSFPVFSWTILIVPGTFRIDQEPSKRMVLNVRSSINNQGHLRTMCWLLT